jgi:hypothetical protein
MVHIAAGVVRYVCLAVCVTLALSAYSGDSPRTGTVSGTIVDRDGNPVAAARVRMYAPYPQAAGAKKFAESLSDEHGRFKLGPIEAVYRNRPDLLVEAEGFAPLSTLGGEISVYPDREVDLGKLVLDRGRVFTGRVLDVDGKPRANATVSTGCVRNYLGHTVANILPERTVTTDTDGRFQTTSIPAGFLSLTVRVPERRLAHLRRPVRPDGAEDLGEIRLENDVPVMGMVKDEDGKPLAGVTIGGTVGHDAVTDNQGKFTLRGFEPNPKFQLNVSKTGYAGLIGMVTVTGGGVVYDSSSGKDKEKAPAKDLVVTLKRTGRIEGQAIDADTGEPVRLSKIVVCNFDRKPSGEVVLRGCRNDAFEQPEPGRFVATFWAPDEYHLTFSADAYLDAEAFTPKMTDLSTIRGIVAKMRKKSEGSVSELAKQTIRGTVTRGGRPVASGWVGLWAVRRMGNAANACVMRGRMVEGDPIPYASARIEDGAYSLDVPYQDDNWYVVVEEPGHAITQVGPISIALRQDKKLDIACSEGGRIRGRVKDVPSGWEGHAWVVAFNKSGVRAEARVDHNGDFELPLLPPGEYGLKIGHDSRQDPEVYPGKLAFEHPEAFQKKPDPWKQAKVVKVEAGRDSTGFVMEYSE